MHYWQRFALRDKRLEDMRSVLLSSPQSAHELGLPDVEPVDAFLTLLRSNDPDAVCVALNYFSYAESMTRHGVGNRLADNAEEVFDQARMVLRSALADGDDPHLTESRAETALHAIQDMLEPQDADLVVGALRKVAPENDSAGIVSSAAGFVLEKLRPEHPATEELLGILAARVFDESVPIEERRSALGAIAMSSSKSVTQLLLKALDLPNIELQAVAGSELADIDLERFRPRLRSMVATWPEVSEFPAHQLVQLLK